MGHDVFSWPFWGEIRSDREHISTKKKSVGTGKLNFGGSFGESASFSSTEPKETGEAGDVTKSTWFVE